MKTIFKVIENTKVAAKTWRMVLEGDTSRITTPGQFVNLEVEGHFLRRPISLCDAADGKLTLLYDVVGEGTELMSRWKPGHLVDTLTGLGNGFDPDCNVERPLLLGGGIGVAPLLLLARFLVAAGRSPIAVLGFNKAEDIVLVDELRLAGAEVYVATADGSAGTKGFVTDAIREHCLPTEYFYACGPMPMLRALALGMDCPGELSLDDRMACGFGVCMCCSIKTRSGAKRICKDGPVFKKEELIFE